MKKCPYCKIDVGGAPKVCPLCQSRLTGEDEEPYFPNRTELQFRSFIYKLQLFIAWAVMIATLGLDFLKGIRFPEFPQLHWSLLLAMWIIAVEFLIIRLFRLSFPCQSYAATSAPSSSAVICCMMIRSSSVRSMLPTSPMPRRSSGTKESETPSAAISWGALPMSSSREPSSSR